MRTSMILFGLLLVAPMAHAQTYGTVLLVPGSAPQALIGMSGGNIDASQLGMTATGPCAGFIAGTPDFAMTLAGDFPYLVVAVEGSGDATLVVQGPDGIFCNDDAVGLHPVLAGSWLAGTYYIWVGEYGQTSAPFNIYFTEMMPSAPIAQTPPEVLVPDGMVMSDMPAYQPGDEAAWQIMMDTNDMMHEGSLNIINNIGGGCVSDSDCMGGVCVGGTCY